MPVKLGIAKENYWLDLDVQALDQVEPIHLRLLVRPLTTATYAAARSRASRRLAALALEFTEVAAVGGDVTGLPDLDDEDERSGVAQMLFAQCLAVSAMVEWEGVEMDDDEPAPVKEENICELMRNRLVSDAFLEAYTRPYEQIASEGEGSGAEPSGTSATAPTTASNAETETIPAPEDSPAQPDTIAAT